MGEPFYAQMRSFQLAHPSPVGFRLRKEVGFLSDSVPSAEFTYFFHEQLASRGRPPAAGHLGPAGGSRRRYNRYVSKGGQNPK